MAVLTGQAGLDNNPHGGGTSALLSIRRLIRVTDDAKDPESVFRALAAELLSVLDAEEVHIHHLSSSGGGEELVVIYLFDGEGRLSYLLPRGERSPGVSWVASTGQPFVASSPRELAASLPRLMRSSAGVPGAEVSSALLIPLSVAEEPEAVAVLVRREQEMFSDSSIELGRTLVDQAAAALALLRARAEAGTDPVTGCMNHRAMQQRLQEEISRAYRSDSPLACLLIDLDNFKAVNDRHGHQAGDVMLREVAQALMGEFRSFDRVARYGGDEFVVILPNADSDSAVAAAQRALERLSSLRSFERELGVASSIGVAQWSPPMTPEELLQSCDAALLASKRAGKGRVTRAARESST
jgi:diguanylate cyclase (GGDEF)-like protein